MIRIEPVVGGDGDPDLVSVLAFAGERVLEPTAVEIGGISMEHRFADVFENAFWNKSIRKSTLEFWKLVNDSFKWKNGKDNSNDGKMKKGVDINIDLITSSSIWQTRKWRIVRENVEAVHFGGSLTPKKKNSQLWKLELEAELF